MSNLSRDGSDRSDRSDVQLPYIVRANLDDRTAANARRLPSPLIQERPNSADDWIGSQQRDLPLYPRPPSADPHDQLKMFKEELAKRDRLIAQLSSIETPRPKPFDSSRIDELYSNERMAAAVNAKSEATALHVRIEGLQSQLRDAHNQIDVRGEKLQELNLTLETAKENEAKHAALVQSLREQLVQYEAQMSIFEGNASRSELVIKTLTENNEASQRRILELEGHLRCNWDDQKNKSRNQENADLRLNNLMQQLSSLIPESEVSTLTPELIIASVKDLNREVIESRTKMLAARERLLSLELDQKADRETILRLAAEAQKEKDSTACFSTDLESVKRESEASKMRVMELQNELKYVSELLENTQTALAATRKEFDERLHREDRRQDSLNRDLELRQKPLRESLVALLGDEDGALNDKGIRDKVENLLMTVKDKTIRIELLQGKLRELAEQLHHNREESLSSELVNKLREPGNHEFEHRLRKAEDELAAGEVLRDELRADKEKFLKFLEVLSRTLSMDSVTIDLGLDGAAAAILACAEQVMKNGSSALVDRKTQIYGLQRQIKTLKEQHDSKDLHMDLLRKKVVSLEERIAGKSEVEREKDSEFVKNRKLLKLVEKYKCELNETHVEIRDLKARLLRTSEIQNKSLQSDQRITELEAKIAELEAVRGQQSGKIASLKDLVKTNSGHTERKDEIASNTIKALTSELRTTKQALEETTKREHQLLELRQVVSRMLGLDLNSLAVPDYEVVTRLEKLIVANQANAATALVLDSAIADLGDGFHAGYQDAARSLALATRSFNNPYRRPVGLRSASPQRRFESPAF